MVSEQELTAVVLEGGRTVAWERMVPVTYVVAAEWRAAVEGERCRFGAGGFRAALGCGRPAVITRDKRRSDGVTVRFPFCGEHAGARVALADGRVAEPKGEPS